MSEPIRINQSTIKRLGSPVVCPARYYGEEVSKAFRKPASDSMIAGQYFEYITFGTKNREGEVPVMKRLKNGEKSTAQIRIEKQSARMIEVLDKLNIKVVRTDFHSEYLINGVIIHGTQDNLCDWNNEAWIMDCKLTGNVNSTFGAYSSWGLYQTLHPKYLNHGIGDDVKVYYDKFDAAKFKAKEQMDMLQAHAYMYIMELKTGKKWKFAYIVADYKPKMEIKVIVIEDSPEGRQNMLDRLASTKGRLEYFRRTNYDAIPTWSECKDCPIKTCASRMLVKPDESTEQEFEHFDESPVDIDQLLEPVVLHANLDEDPFA
jgi:hypothetical protein